MKQSDFKKGQKWRVIREGSRLHGLQPTAPYVQQGWGQDLKVGDVLTCQGVLWTHGDGVPIVKWTGANGEWLANDCEFTPSVGGMWASAPADGYLEPV